MSENWTAETNDGVTKIKDGTGVIAECLPEFAAKIAAAPELFEALDGMIEDAGNCMDELDQLTDERGPDNPVDDAIRNLRDRIETAKAAIAKAKGAN
jgi:hypothetical protein